MCVILHLIRRRRPKRFLEIGTHWGVTTRNIARRFPEMEIVTVDPGDRIPVGDRPSNQTAEFLPQSEIGKLVVGFSNVRIIREQFREVDWQSQHFDMIYVDGNHALSEVLQDTHLAIRLITNPGVIIWHDFNHVPDIKKALEQIQTEGPIVTLHNTWIAYLDTH
jgi:predicted O-methyltransferase YrrM